MQISMMDKHNSIVEPEDTVWHLGDFYLGDNWKEIQTILSKLNGKHHLVIGNHDWLYVWNYIEAGFLSVHTSFNIDGYNLVHDPAVAGVIKEQKWIHGHTHGLGLRLNENTYCVCVELHDYCPVDFDHIKSVF